MAGKEAMGQLSKQYKKACMEELRKSMHKKIDEFLGNDALGDAYKQEVIGIVASHLTLHELMGQ